MFDGTRKFRVSDDADLEMKQILTAVYDALREKGGRRRGERTAFCGALPNRARRNRRQRQAAQEKTEGAKRFLSMFHQIAKNGKRGLQILFRSCMIPKENSGRGEAKWRTAAERSGRSVERGGSCPGWAPERWRQTWRTGAASPAAAYGGRPALWRRRWPRGPVLSS